MLVFTVTTHLDLAGDLSASPWGACYSTIDAARTAVIEAHRECYDPDDPHNPVYGGFLALEPYWNLDITVNKRLPPP